MDMISATKALEKRAAAIGVSFKEILDKAEVHRTTWERWGNGSNMPRMVTWDAVVTELERREALAAEGTQVYPLPKAS